MKFTIAMDYFGSRLSVNNMKVVRRGVKTHHTWPEVTEWMSELAERARILKGNTELKTPIKIHLTGHFKDDRHPDLDNLFKATCDALKHGLGIDDKYFIPIAEGYETGFDDQELIITVEDSADEG